MIIRDTDNLVTGAYILNKNKLPYTPFQNHASFFLTEENSTFLKAEILKIIGESDLVLKLCSFIITDKEIFEAILNKAKSANTAIFLLTQLDQTKLANYSSLRDFLTEEEIKENPSQAHLNYIKKLFDNGVHVRAATSAHAKFIVSDRKVGFITSANFTTPSLTFNTESGVYLDANSSKELDRLFDVIFQQGTSYRQFVNSSNKNKMLVVQSEDKIDNDLLPAPSLSNLRYTYENHANNLYDEMIKVVDDASKFLYISTYSIVGINLIEEFAKAIENASKRGVSIYLFCRGMNYRGDHLAGSEVIQRKGCQIYANVFNHSKGIISEKTGLLFTANIDGNHGLKNGFEVGYVLDEFQRQEFLSIHKHLIESADYVYQSNPTRLDLFQTYEGYEKTKGINPPIFPRDLCISFSSGLKVNNRELAEHAIFYGKSKDQEYIIAGGSYYKCKFSENTFLLTAIEKPRFDLEKYILKYNNLKIIQN